MDAATRIDVEGDVFDMTSTLVSPNASNLWSGSLSAAVNYDSMGDAIDTSSWSGSTLSGAKTSDNCSDWSDSTAGSSAEIGDFTSSTVLWLDNGSDTCDQVHSLYCISQ